MHYGYPHRRRHDRRPRATGWTRKASAPSTISAASAVPEVTEWKHLDLNYKIVARIDRGQVHRLRPLLHRLLGRRAPVHPPRPRDGRSTAIELTTTRRSRNAQPARASPVTPDRANWIAAASSRTARTRRRLRAFRAWMKTECVGCNLCCAGLPGGGLHHDGARSTPACAPETWAAAHASALRNGPRAAE